MRNLSIRNLAQTCLIAAFSSATCTAVAAILHVPAGADLQAAIDRAAPGDTITLEPGATYQGLFKLRRKAGNQYITIRIADESLLPPDGTRISPAAATVLPKLIAPDNRPPLQTEAGAHRYRLIGIEIRPPKGVYASELVLLGSPGALSAADQPFNIILDRLYIHGDPTVGAKRGITLNSGFTVIKNCYISDIKSDFQDSQAIAGWNGPGPYEILNNYLEASGENVMFGGALPSIQGLVPSDIVFRKNYCFKPTSWRKDSPDFAGKTWIVKNLFELKNARRVLIEHNVFENNWAQAQAGFGIVFTVRAESGSAPWAVIEDVIFSQNIVKNCGAGVNILARDYNSNLQGIVRRLLIKDNLFLNIDHTKWPGEGRLFQILWGPEDLTIDHNTAITSNLRHTIIFDGSYPCQRLIVTNNIFPHGQYGVFGNAKGTGTVALDTYAPDSVFRNNVLAGGSATKYPTTNFFPPSLSAVDFQDYAGGDYRLSPTSPYRLAGTDGKDLGADIAAIDVGISDVVSGTSFPNQVPMAQSVTPATGEGSLQAFTFIVSDGNGFNDIRSAQLLFNSTLAPSGGCYVRYLRGGNSLSLRDDTGTAWLGPATIGVRGVLANSQCEIHLGDSSASGSENILKVTLKLQFKPSFRGLKTVYVLGEDFTSATSGWQPRGSWLPAPNSAPQAVSVTPASGEGLQQVFQFVVSDPDGADDLRSAHVLLNSTLSGAKGCYLLYRFQDRTLWLRDDAGAVWLGPVTLQSSGSIRNSQCLIDTAGSSASLSVGSAALTIALSFSPSFLGDKNVYLLAEDALFSQSGWQLRGRWTPARNSPPNAISLTPSSGEGLQQVFQFVVSDPNGAGNLQSVHFLVNGSLSGVGACYLVYTVATDTFSLGNDQGIVSNGPTRAGTSSTLVNNQCVLNVGASGASMSDDRLTVFVTIAFKKSFWGQKYIYILADDEGFLNSGWQRLGTWTPIPNEPPVVNVFSPSSGEGSQAIFTARISDPNGVRDLLAGYFLIGSQLSPAVSCYFRYQPGTGLLLRDDSGSSWLGPVGASATLANSQCAIGPASSTVDVADDTLILSVAVQFQSSFSGLKAVYLLAEDRGYRNSGWKRMGSWTIPGEAKAGHVPVGWNLQQGIDGGFPSSSVTAKPREVYEKRVVFVKNFVAELITICTLDPAELRVPVTRITLSGAASVFRVIAANNVPACCTDQGPDRFGLAWHEMSVGAGVYSFGPITFGFAGAASSAEQGANFELHRLYPHANRAVGCGRGITLNSLCLKLLDIISA